MRLLVTGSRDWPWLMPVQKILDGFLKNSDALEEPFYLKVGDCPDGVDKAARQWWGWGNATRMVAPDSLKVFEADWDKYGKGAGPIRNQAMVDSGADYFVAFRYRSSRGTTDCIERAKHAGIPGRVYDLAVMEFE